MSSVAGPQVITTGGAQPQNGMAALTNNQVALWVAGYMLIGLAGLIVVALIFRKRVEI